MHAVVITFDFPCWKTFLPSSWLRSWGPPPSSSVGRPRSCGVRRRGGTRFFRRGLVLGIKKQEHTLFKDLRRKYRLRILKKWQKVFKYRRKLIFQGLVGWIGIPPRRKFRVQRNCSLHRDSWIRIPPKRKFIVSKFTVDHHTFQTPPPPPSHQLQPFYYLTASPEHKKI